MKSSERARQWVEREDLRPFESLWPNHAERAEAFDAGCLATLREVEGQLKSCSLNTTWLDRRIAELEGR